MLAHSDVMAGKPGEAQPKEPLSIMAHHNIHRSVHVRICSNQRKRVAFELDSIQFYVYDFSVDTVVDDDTNMHCFLDF